MKKIGLLGGMSYESTITYYQIMNETVKNKLGGFHSAKIILYSVDFAEIEECQKSGNWEKSAEILSSAARALERAGADLIVICTNTMHKVASRIQSEIKIPILHIADAASAVLKEQHITRAALLGTKYTMTQPFYKDKLSESGIEVIIPEEPEIELINHVIYHELCMGIINKQSKDHFLAIMNRLHQKEIQGIILGCTEIGLLIRQEDTTLPVFDTTLIHAVQAAKFALEN